MKYEERIEKREAKAKAEVDEKIFVEEMKNKFMAFRLNQIIRERQIKEKNDAKKDERDFR